MKNKRVLIVDNDQAMLDLLQDYLSQEGFSVEAVLSGADAIERVAEVDYEIVITDLKMQGIDGMEVLRAVKGARPDTQVILITAFGSIESAIEAMKEGAFHYLTKPFKLDELCVVIEKALEDRRLRLENLWLKREVERRYRFDNLVGKSKRMQEVFDLIPKVAESSSNILIYGESGTGKELVAKAIHYNSPRKESLFLPINCAAIPETLLESELFGHMKGAFTGAHVSRRGLIEEAEGGTVFLDEVADLTTSLQAKLLRVLQDKEIRPVGGRETFKVDVRFIAATNKDLKKMVEQGTFREDLYYRLAVIPIHLPPLRDRPEDIPLLVEHFLKKCADAAQKKVRGISQEAMALLLNRPWKGNVRELENVIEALVALTKNSIITVNDMTIPLGGIREGRPFLFDTPIISLEELEKSHISEVLRKTGGNKKEAARLLGISRKTLYRKEEKYGLKIKD